VQRAGHALILLVWGRHGSFFTSDLQSTRIVKTKTAQQRVGASLAGAVKRDIATVPSAAVLEFASSVQLSMRSRTLTAKSVITNGLVTTIMPGSR
jgi:hypothetical protein